MPTLLIEDVVLDGDPVSIRCEDGRIAAIERATTAAPADDTLDGRGAILHPPLINAHTHSAMTLFRGTGGDLPLMEWLERRVWPYERGITEEDVYAGARLAILEMLRSGTVFFNDMYWHFEGTARAVREMGVRAYLAAVLIDLGDPGAARALREGTERLARHAGDQGERISVAVGPHSIYTVSEDSLRWAGELAREHDLLLHVHLAETSGEVEDCRARHGCTPVEYLDRLGLLSERTVAAHTVWVSASDIRLLGERRVVCVHNPVSNMRLAVGGVYPHRPLAAAGAVCAIGTDGAGANDNLDLLEELKVAALLQKHHAADAAAITVEQALAMAIDGPARAFGIAGPAIEVGRPADLILIDATSPEMEPPRSIASHLVYSASGAVVDSAVCDGRVVMRHRRMPGEEEIVAKAREAAARVFARVDGAA